MFDKKVATINHLKWLIEQLEKKETKLLYFGRDIDTQQITVDGVIIERVDTGVRTETIIWKEK